jgi:hypothetical protein
MDGSAQWMSRSGDLQFGQRPPTWPSDKGLDLFGAADAPIPLLSAAPF